ncbi:MAG: HAD hydrolase-like protein [Lentisphaerota bacterium]
MSEKFKNLLFDLDGTIIDPKVGITKSIQYALQKMGCEKIPSSDELTWCIGPPLVNSFPKLLGRDDIEPEFAQRGVDYYREYFSEYGINECHLYEDIKIVLEKLASSKKLRIFIATSKPTIYAVRILKRFQIFDLFSGVYGSEMDGTFSNKAKLIEHIIKKEKLIAFESLMIGDREHDMIGAKTNNMLACGVLYGYGSEKELTKAGASFIGKTPKDLLRFGF